MRAAIVFVATFVLIVVAGCGNEDSPSPTPPPAAIAGTSVAFDLDADWQQPDHYYDFPTASDLRLSAAGTPDVSGFPATKAVLRPVKTIAGLRRGFPVTPAGFFLFDAPLADREDLAPIAATRTAPILLIDVDPDSPERGRLFPTVATVPPPDSYTPPNLLAVAAMPGVVLHPNRTYAFVVMRRLGDATGAPLGQPLALAQLRAGQVPSAARGAVAIAQYSSLWETLRTERINAAEVAAASVFTTGDVVAELAGLTNAMVDRYALSVENVHVDPDDGSDHDGFCELHAVVRMPQFQAGQPPFTRGGLFVYDSDGLPIEQRQEDVPISVNLPVGVMPAAGYPLVLYFHGTGGLSTQVVDRGATTEPNGIPEKGKGPAYVLAARGIASVGAAMPLNPERLPGVDPGATNRSYLNLENLGSYPDTFRQGTIEQRLLLDALGRLRIAPEVVRACAGLALPEGASHYLLDTSHIALLGQSLGGQFTNYVGAVEPRAIAVVPTGSGGYWSLVTLLGEAFVGVDSHDLISLVLGTAKPLSHLHPALQLVQTAFEPADPVVFAARLGRDPLPGHPPRHIYQPVGKDDPDFPNGIYDLMALASGTQQAGDIEWVSLQEALATDGREGILAYPQANNQRATDGRRFTAIVAQYEADGILPAHHIFAQLDAVKFQYGCFIESALRTGVGVVTAPMPLGSECPRE